MSNLQEKQFYLHLLSFASGPASDVMKLYFEVKILNKSNFETFLNDQNNKHILFHKCFPTTLCCRCRAECLASPMKTVRLPRRQLDLLYNTGLPNPNHEKMRGLIVSQHCLCKYSAKCSIGVDQLDISFFCVIIQHCCPSEMNFMWINSIRNVRNFLAHSPTISVTKDVFEEKWNALQIATLGFAAELGRTCLLMFQEEIARIQQLSLTNQLKEVSDYSNDHIEVCQIKLTVVEATLPIYHLLLDLTVLRLCLLS